MIEKLEYQDHDEWLKLRSGFIGGSDSAAVIGLNPYKSRYALWAEKTGKLPAFEGNTTTKVGAFLEDLVAQMFEEEMGKKVHKVNSSFHNTDYDFAIANLDRKVVGEQAFLECKTTTSIPVMKTVRNGEVPSVYYTQCVHYLAVTGFKKAYLAVLINCRDFKVYEIDRDDEEIKALMDAEREFWNLVETKTPPAVDGDESTSDTLSALYPDATDREVDLSPLSKELKEYTDLSAQIKELTKLKDEKANVIKNYMKDASRGKHEGYSITFKGQSKITFNDKAFATDHKDMNLEKYYKISNYRTLKITEKENK